MSYIKKVSFSSLFLFLSIILSAQKQTIKLNITDLMRTAADQSPSALVAKYNFLASYWQFCTYKAQILPSIELNASAGQYNRSLVSLQNYETGSINYVQNNNLQNAVSLSVDQNIALTGGTISLITSLSRLDQFSPDKMVTYYSKPINIYYTQPIKAFNSFKWNKIIEPKQFENAKREYLESIEAINIEAITLFFNALAAQLNLDMAAKNLQFAGTAVSIAQERYLLGSVNKNDLLQLRLRMNNNKLSLNDCKINLEVAIMKLRSFLGYNDNVNIELIAPEEIPVIQLDFNDVFEKALLNSSQNLTNELNLLNAKQSVAKAKSGMGLQATFFAQFGLTQKDNSASGAYRNPMDQEIFGLSLSLPILDWGLGKGKVKLAKSNEDVIKTQVEQAQSEFRQNILISVLQFNNQKSQCDVSQEADSIARISYIISIDRFKNGTIGVMELNNAQSEKDESAKRHLSDLSNYWTYYYTIRKLTLFDFLNKSNITADFDKIVGN